jgi:uncharacterized phiE125 gp8 family phage protein
MAYVAPGYVAPGYVADEDAGGPSVTGLVAGIAAYTVSAIGAVAGAVGDVISGSVAGQAVYSMAATGAVSGSVTDAPIGTEPVTLAQAKLAARIDIGDTARDSEIQVLITAARQLAEQETGRELVRKTRRFQLAEWPAAGDVLHVYEPVAVAISYWSGGAWVDLATDAFAFGEAGSATAVAPALGTAWPALADRAVGPRVRVDVTAGPADPTTAPESVKLYIKALVAWWIDNPSAVAHGGVQPAPFLRSLLDPVRLWA